MSRSSPEFVYPVLGVGEPALEDVVVLLQLREDLLGLLQGRDSIDILVDVPKPVPNHVWSFEALYL